MQPFLVFSLYGPLAAWGDIAVGEQRPTTPHPPKSAILGLLAAALGISRDEDAMHQALADGYGYAVRIDAGGVLQRDYHTTQQPDQISRLKHLRTRRDELQDRHNLYTVLSTRDYRCDGLYTICLWWRDGAPYSAEILLEALNHPRWALYLGRKSCPLALPLLARCTQAETFEKALELYDAESIEVHRHLQSIKNLLSVNAACPDYYWDDPAPTLLSPLHTTPRQDIPLSRKRWQFSKRNEHYRRGTS
jgi:CRISPR system Cascade subunit CasD